VNIDMSTRPLRHTGAAWRLYQDAFAEINVLAAQRHMMTEGEFMDAWFDKRVQKWISVDDHNELIGLGVQTTDLTSWPLISPAYFALKWPELYTAHKIWYVGFVCTRQDPPAPIDTFGAVIRAMSAETRAAGGISVMDYCTANVNRGLPKGALRLLSRAGEVEMEPIDAQTFYAYDFSGTASL
jgi:hypothetical protein